MRLLSVWLFLETVAKQKVDINVNRELIPRVSMEFGTFNVNDDGRRAFFNELVDCGAHANRQRERVLLNCWWIDRVLDWVESTWLDITWSLDRHLPRRSSFQSKDTRARSQSNIDATQYLSAVSIATVSYSTRKDFRLPRYSIGFLSTTSSINRLKGFRASLTSLLS